MNRRDFSKMLGTAISIPSFSAAANEFTNKANTGFSLKYAPHFGMFKNHAGENLIDQLHFMHEMGFRALEDNEMMERPIEMQQKIGETLGKLGMEMGVFVVKFDGFFDKSHMTTGKKEWTDLFLKSCKQAVETAKRVNAKWMTVVPGNYTRELPIGIQTGHVIDNLKKAAEIFEPNHLAMVLEPLSDNPDLFLRHADQSFAICKAVGSSACKTLFDIYHMQRNDGNLIKMMEWCWEEIAYVQIGDNPGRKEPGTGEINYGKIFDFLRKKNYQGVLGMEHGNFYPGKEGEQKLIEAYQKTDKAYL